MISCARLLRIDLCTWCHWWRVYMALSATVNIQMHHCSRMALRVSVALVRNLSSARREAPHPVVSVPTLQARKQRLVRDAIWDAAIDLFAQEGFDETTVDDIARAAGVSRRSFFRYF